MSSNVTAVTPTAKTYLEIWPNKTGGTKPTASNLNPQAGQTVATIEAMKMEASITAPVAGTVSRLAVRSTQGVEGGDLVLVIG